MKLNCIHCGGAFTVRGEQLGAAVACPHCHSTVNLPRADDGSGEQKDDDRAAQPSGTLTNSVSALTSFIIHTLLFILIALLPDDGSTASFDRSTINETFKKPFDAALLAERLRTLIGAKKELV